MRKCNFLKIFLVLCFSVIYFEMSSFDLHDFFQLEVRETVELLKKKMKETEME